MSAEQKKTPAKLSKPKCPVCGKPVDHGQTYCSSECELASLRRKLAEQDERLARVARKKDPVRCYGRVQWETCVQEWYTKASYDAKRRTAELRNLGYNCTAQCVGNMPVMHNGELTSMLMTIVTCHLIDDIDGKLSVPPHPTYILGLGIPVGYPNV